MRLCIVCGNTENDNIKECSNCGNTDLRVITKLSCGRGQFSGNYELDEFERKYITARVTT